MAQEHAREQGSDQHERQHAKILRTKAAIQAAFVELVNEKGFTGLSVTDITRTAGINRGTFYIHYVDKFDLLDQLKSETLGDIQRYLDEVEPPKGSDENEAISYSAILQALQQVVQKRDILVALVSDQSDQSFVADVRSYLKKKIEQTLPSSHGSTKKRGRIREDYLDIILYDEILGIIIQWLRTGAKESPEEIATLITETRLLSPLELLSSYEVIAR